jgi:uncharacterized membrane protein
MAAKKEPKKDILLREEFTHSFSYFPYFIGPLVMFFLADSDRKKLMVHIKYSSVIAFIAILCIIAMNSFFTWLVSLLYLGLSIFLALKAYSWEKIQIDFIDSLEDSVQEKLKK